MAIGLEQLNHVTPHARTDTQAGSDSLEPGYSSVRQDELCKPATGMWVKGASLLSQAPNKSQTVGRLRREEKKRWEMQEEAELEDGEKSMVEELKKAYFVCRCSPGPSGPPEAEETLAERTHGETQASDKSAVQ
ncbi:hypothetical protein D9C73_012287 [Collichthys lucidus]|uniref:Uncharacterized protein n=1 Tax=Collichthys lucidus TaxID=240159 RepID=A0A4U5UUI7_COLLU|nr:hypothetical protein D9C73_012287 [Collichthys lucidus]